MGSKATIIEYLDDDAVLTQYGDGHEPFRNSLRMGEPDMSLIYGKQDPIAAALIVTKIALPGAVVRHAVVRALAANQDLPLSRRDIVERARNAVQQLASH